MSLDFVKLKPMSTEPSSFFQKLRPIEVITVTSSIDNGTGPVASTIDEHAARIGAETADEAYGHRSSRPRTARST